MIKDTDETSFEEMRTIEQELTFTEAKCTFDKYHVDFSEEKFVALGLRHVKDGMYTNLAEILSDQCKHTVKIAVFQDADNLMFKDAKEFGGSIFKQLNDSYEYLTLCNRTMATFRGLERVEHSDYPESALREAMLNALIHRDYSYSGSIIINVNDNAMEFISLGGLLPGITTEDIKNGISQPRNAKLAAIFHRLRLIESYGTGIRKIYSLYKDEAVQPQILVTDNTFKLVLPNMNLNHVVNEIAELEVEKSSTKITPQMQMVIDYLRDYDEISDNDLQELLNIKKTRAYVLTRQMAKMGLINISGRGKSRKYQLK